MFGRFTQIVIALLLVGSLLSDARAQLMSVGTLTELTTGTNDFNPRYSPSGDAIAFARGIDYTQPGGTGTSIYRMTPDGVTTSLLKQSDGLHNLTLGGWYSSGLRVMYLADRVNDQSLRAVDSSDGSGECVLVSSNAINAALTSDSTGILFPSGTYFAIKPLKKADLSNCTVTNSNTVLTSNTVAPRVSFDGTQMAVSVVGPQGSWSIATSNLDGANLQIVVSGASTNYYPAWSPDGKYLAFVSDRAQSGKLELWIVRLSDGTLQRLTTTGGIAAPDWSPDGSRIAFTRNYGLNSQAIYTLQLATVPVVLSGWGVN